MSSEIVIGKNAFRDKHPHSSDPNLFDHHIIAVLSLVLLERLLSATPFQFSKLYFAEACGDVFVYFLFH